MTTEEYIAKLRAKLNDLVQNNKPLARAVASVHADQMERIFVDGQATSGLIGTYSTKPMYVSKTPDLKSFPTKGKTGKTKFNNGKNHASAFFANGYKGFRASQNRQNSFVDLKLTGQLQKDMSNSLTRLNPSIWVTGTKNKINSEKAEGAENKYGNIFNLSKDEKENFKEILRDELLIALR